MMTKKYWRQVLSDARRLPAMFIGPLRLAHLTAIMEPLRIIYQTRAFKNVRSVEVTLSPNEFRLECHSGPLVGKVARLIAWRDCDNLVDELNKAGRRVLEASQWGEPGADPRFRYVHIGCLGGPLQLARYGTVGVRASDGFFVQSYVESWPVVPPHDAPNPEELGFLLTAALDNQWFTSIPYDIEELEGAAGVFGDVPLKLNWSDSDGLVTHPYRVLATGLPG